MPKQFEGKFHDIFAAAREDFERQFLADRQYQSAENWKKILGESVRGVREAVAALVPEMQDIEPVLMVIAQVATMAAVTDFMLDTFPKEALRSGGS